MTQAPLFKGVRSGKLKRMLQEAVQSMRGTGEDAEATYQEALAALREAGEEAAEALGREYESLPEDQYVNRWAVAQLLTELRDPRTLGLLDEIVASPIPKERSPDPHGSSAAREVVIRTTAVEAVVRLAGEGSDEAREILLKHARSPVRSIKIAAAMGYLEQGGRQARAELRRVMDKSDQWILSIRRAHPSEVPPIEGHRFLAPRSPSEPTPPPAPEVGGSPERTAPAPDTEVGPYSKAKESGPPAASPRTPAGRKANRARRRKTEGK